VTSDIRRVDALQLKAQLHDGGEIAVLDAREEGVFARWHLLLASCVPLSRLELLVDDLVPRRTARVVWCDDGDGASVIAARRMMARVDADHRALGDARIRLAGLDNGAERLVARVPAALQNDPGLLYERMRWRWRKDHYADAIAILEHPPEDLVRPFTAARHLADRQSSGLLQAIMTDFILDGHFARHLRRMRALYAERQDFLVDQVARRLGGLLDIGPRDSGMYLVAWLPPDRSDRAVAAALATAGITALPLSALTLAAARPPGLVLGYTGHGEVAMARVVERMAAVLERKIGLINHSKLELR